MVTDPGVWTAVADSIAAHRDQIICAYERHLRDLGSPLAHDEASRRQVIANADHILGDVVDSVRAGEVRINEQSIMLAREIGLSRAARGMRPRESLAAATILYDIIVTAVVPHLLASPEALQIFAVVVRALHKSLTVRIQEAATSYTGYLLDRIHEAHVEERRHLARELHDRVGQELSAAHRQLELCEYYRAVEPGRVAEHAATAQQALHETMDNLRAVTTGLRQEEPIASLENALLGYLETAPVDGTTVRLRVNGDASWVPQTVQDEAFLILREAVSNALVHGRPQKVLIGVDLAPHELSAWVEDDGIGFDPDKPSDGVGLASMRERAELMGGNLLVATRPRRGTRVELLVPLQRVPA